MPPDRRAGFKPGSRPVDNPRVALIRIPYPRGSNVAPASLKFERRRVARTPAAGEAMAAFYDADGAIALTSEELIDASAKGIGLRSSVEIEPGARFMIYAGGSALAHRGGVVARCTPDGDGWRLGVLCDARMAA